MRIISHRKLKEFYETPGREDSKVALERWYQIAEEAEWRNFSDIRTDFPDADYVGNQHYVFNIRGNRYRLVVVIKFTIGRLFVRFVGTHSEYDKIDFSIKSILEMTPIKNELSTYIGARPWPFKPGSKLAQIMSEIAKKNYNLNLEQGLTQVTIECPTFLTLGYDADIVAICSNIPLAHCIGEYLDINESIIYRDIIIKTLEKLNE